MKKLLLALLLLALLTGAALLALWITFGATAGGMHLIVNGNEVDLSHLGDWHAAAGGMAALLALCVVALALALPLALALGVLLPLLLLVGAMLLVCASALGIGALALSPLLLLVLLVWWLSRRSRRPAATGIVAGRTTIDA